MVTVDEVTRELEKVVDPEIGLPITEMHLVDEITIKEDGELFIRYHLTAPFCPPIFAEDIGMNIRLMPVTGVPLPLLSYGGSSVLGSLIAIGLLQNVYIYRKAY